MSEASETAKKSNGLPGCAWTVIGFGLLLLVGLLVFGILIYYNKSRLDERREIIERQEATKIAP